MMMDMNAPTVSQEVPVMLFDGVCVLCNGSVRFVMKRSKNLKFCAMQSDAGQAWLWANDMPLEEFETFALVIEGVPHFKSDGIIGLTRFMGAGWRLLGRVIGVLPHGFRDWMYDRMARNRYKVFGRRDACMIPTEAERDRFIL